MQVPVLTHYRHSGRTFCACGCVGGCTFSRHAWEVSIVRTLVLGCSLSGVIPWSGRAGKRRSGDPSTRKNRKERPGNHCSLWPSQSRLAVTIQYNHRWTQMNTDKNYSEPHTFMAKTRSPDSDPKQREARPAFGPKNLCSSVFICGFLLHGYGLEPI